MGVRLFVAVELDAAARTAVASTMRQLGEVPGMRWVRPETLHLTLVFLGDTAPELVPEIGGALDEVCEDEGRFDLALSGVGCFGPNDKARVLWVGVDDGGRLAALHEAIGGALEPLGFARETRSFEPHLTIGRARKRAFRMPEGFEAVGEIATLAVDEVALVESELRPEGPRYTVRHRAALGAEAGRAMSD